MQITAVIPCAAGALVHNTKSLEKTALDFDRNTGEILEFSHNPEHVHFDHTDGLLTRYQLQRNAATILGTRSHPRQDSWRVTGCLSRRIGVMGIKSDLATSRCSYKGLMICGSVWTCPVCAAKITQRRATEIQAATDLHYAAGGSVYMITLTFPHSRTDSVSDLVLNLRKALQKYRDSHTYKTVKSDLELIGLIRAVEVTYSPSNGFHPHVHELWLVPASVSSGVLDTVRSDLFTAWKSAAKKAGFKAPNYQHGFNIIRSFSPAEYLTKFGRTQTWNASLELTKSHLKTGHSSLTPWDMLRLYDTDPASYGSLFHEFASAFFGTRQLYWTNGLKAAFGLTEKSDIELSQSDDPSITVCSITAAQWKRVLKSPSDVRGLILRLAETGGSPAVVRFLESLS